MRLTAFLVVLGLLPTPSRGVPNDPIARWFFAGSCSAFNGLLAIRGLCNMAAVALALAPSLAHATCVKDQRPPESTSVVGTLHGVSVTVNLEYSGGNGLADRATAEWLTDGAGFPLTQTLSLRALGSDGDRMDAFFAGPYLYVQNAVYRPGEAHCCFTTLGVQRFKMDIDSKGHHELHRAGIANAPYIKPGPHDPQMSACPENMWDSSFDRWLKTKQRNVIVQASYRRT